MAIAWKRIAPYQPELGLTQRAVTEFWLGTGLPQTGGANPVCTLEISDIYDSMPMALGSTHADTRLAGAICTGKKAVEGPIGKRNADGGEVIVAVRYDSNNRYSGGPVSYAEHSSYRDNDWMPRIQILATGSYAKVQWREIPRATCLRTRTVFMALANPEATADAIQLNVGKGYVLGGIPYLLSSFALTQMPTNQSRITYRFQTKTPVLSLVTAGYVTCPALGYLEDYEVSWTATAATIGVRPLTFYGAGSALPGL